VSAGDQVVYLSVGDAERRYVLHTPVGRARGPLPLVLMLDGRGGTPWTAMRSTGWSRAADAAGFLVAYPEALRLDPAAPMHFLSNPQMWNAGTGGSDVERGPVDDIAFLDAVIQDICARFGADDERIHMAGFSNGASMTFRYAVERPARLAAMATVAGHLRVDRCEPAAGRTPLIGIYGGRDPLCPASGGHVALPWGREEIRPAAMDTVRGWAAHLGLAATPSSVDDADGVMILRFGPGARGEEIRTYVVADMGHVWPGGHRLLPEGLVGPETGKLNATAVIWDFFSSRTRG